MAYVYIRNMTEFYHGRARHQSSATDMSSIDHELCVCFLSCCSLRFKVRPAAGGASARTSSMVLQILLPLTLRSCSRLPVCLMHSTFSPLATFVKAVFVRFHVSLNTVDTLLFEHCSREAS